MLEPKNFDCLQDNTRTLLFELKDTAPFLRNYTFVGGSALALYLCHRKSEDLDFFTYEDSFSKSEILDYCRRFENFVILNDSDNQLDLLISGIKATFFNARWKFLQPLDSGPLNIATLDALAAMKINTLFLRAKYRDYYDLYSLVTRVYDLKGLYDCAKGIVPGLTFKLLCIALTYIDDIEDDSIAHLQPEFKLTKEEIRSYFEQQVRNLTF
ncbi:MAG: nucleotidyl transferase AbiEii/AbiGii toxin family protein [Candidatus Omnitrophica bacterium]|nr:nucleotidyl transferase AbiEii/AbiGii toxin family protein [Candidatus Omnitrophota bacterium]